ncbi:hypothetical protein V500_07342 [Pseudogymnoascus sp. VKM F-4518 (FW-2643)]|nr:hypothetical protein V500_07342 [Pseudogymnoascus sp. VKM F-4518 (FW-2643)]
MIQLPHGTSRKHAALALWLLIAIWLFVGLSPSRFSLTTPNPTTPFDDDVFDTPPLDSEALRNICANTTWTPDLVFTCNESVGGIGNIRNSILNCIRFAISAGASLVEPRIVLRNSSNTAAIRTGITTDLSYMFSAPHLRASLHLSCPGLILHPTLASATAGAKTHPPIPLKPEYLQSKSLPRTGLASPSTWPANFTTWLHQHIPPRALPAITIINLQRTYIAYPIYSDGASVATHFGQLLKFRRDIRVLATSTLRALAARYNYPGPLTDAILPGFFFGAHLRTERDAKLGWPGPDWVYSRYETQAGLFLSGAANASLPLIYVASGDRDEVAKLSGEARERNMTVTTKFDVLGEAEVAALGGMSWDQQGMVDFLVMTKASVFGGVGHSSFAWNVALGRHVVGGEGGEEHLKGPQALSDKLSQVYGKPGQYPEYPSTLWP